MTRGFHALRLATLSVAVVLLVIVSAGCKSKQLAGHWTSTPMTIDGQLDDWTDTPVSYFEEQDATVGMANDSSCLYLYLRFQNPMWARTIKMSGLTIYLDANGKHSKDLYIRYAGGVTKEQMKEMMGPRAGEMEEKMGTERRGQFEDRMAREDKFTIVDEERWYLPKELNIAGGNGPAVGYSSARDFFNYEFRIPLAACSADFYGLGIGPGHKLGIGVEWGSDQTGKRPEKMHGRGMWGGGSTGGGMPPDGGMGDGDGDRSGERGGRPGSFPGGERPEMPKKQHVWFKTTLADVTHK